MKKIFHDSLFEYDDDGVLQCYPIDEKDARETYRNLIKEKDDLRTKINQEEHLLDLLSGDNQIENKSSLKVLILLKDRLNKTNDKFESIKNWYDENKIPPPGSPEDNKRIKLQKLYVEKVRERIVNEQISANQDTGQPKDKLPDCYPPINEVTDWHGSLYTLGEHLLDLWDTYKNSEEYACYKNRKDFFTWCSHKWTYKRGNVFTAQTLALSIRVARARGRID